MLRREDLPEIGGGVGRLLIFVQADVYEWPPQKKPREMNYSILRYVLNAFSVNYHIAVVLACCLRTIVEHQEHCSGETGVE